MLNPAPGARFEVWGDPIAHSRSPLLHAAAYRVLGLDWTYGRRRVGEAGFFGELSSLDAGFRGLSLTMPLKTVAFEAAVRRDRAAELSGAVNTFVLTAEGPQGFNTDVGGLIRALREHEIDDVATARIVGAGATATSALIALGELGARRVEVIARRPDRVQRLAEIGEVLGVTVVVDSFDRAPFAPVPVTVATLPGDAPLDDGAADALAASGGLLLDAVYGHWPTALASAWQRVDATAVSGLSMLLHQAVLQVRLFTGADADRALENESAVVDAMRATLTDTAS
ncbi:MAG: shikimate dehydrogenase [Actinobacteria bacterium]|nr:shikimate dehydrogenase [Actinomycetota bacterium]